MPVVLSDFIILVIAFFAVPCYLGWNSPLYKHSLTQKEFQRAQEMYYLTTTQLYMKDWMTYLKARQKPKG